MTKREIRTAEGMTTKKAEVESILSNPEVDIKAVVEVIKQETGKSERIRVLYSMGVEVGEIARLMNIRYNFAYNVVSRTFGEVRKTQKENKSSQIRDLWKKDMTIGEIAKELNINYNYVWSVVDKERKKEETQ